MNLHVSAVATNETHSEYKCATAPLKATAIRIC